ncbi:MAG: hypothetical protein GXY33_13745 [Phycisphaerae bacterium]|nr:hypothetical protein [Phycisphaerae bacterium]
MAARITIEFVKLHRWHRPLGFAVFHRPDWFLSSGAEMLTGLPVRLWANVWEKAGFGHGRFGTGSFGWAQGGVTGGGFGCGRFGCGEFGYYNEPFSWTTPRSYRDGYHSFGVRLIGSNGKVDLAMPSRLVFVTSVPAAPRWLELASVSYGRPTVRWTASADLPADS